MHCLRKKKLYLPVESYSLRELHRTQFVKFNFMQTPSVLFRNSDFVPIWRFRFSRTVLIDKSPTTDWRVVDRSCRISSARNVVDILISFLPFTMPLSMNRFDYWKILGTSMLRSLIKARSRFSRWSRKERRLKRTWTMNKKKIKCPTGELIPSVERNKIFENEETRPTGRRTLCKVLSLLVAWIARTRGRRACSTEAQSNEKVQRERDRGGDAREMRPINASNEQMNGSMPLLRIHNADNKQLRTVSSWLSRSGGSGVEFCKTPAGSPASDLSRHGEGIQAINSWIQRVWRGARRLAGRSTIGLIDQAMPR